MSSSPTSNEASNSEVKQSDVSHKFKFPSHENHVLNLGKSCRENNVFTDCILQCDDGSLKAHRVVLSLISPFLKMVFQNVPLNLPEAVVILIGTKVRMVRSLLDFFYTGEMTVDRNDTAELHILFDTLNIDPNFISVSSIVSKAKDSPSANEVQQTASAIKRSSSSQDSESASTEDNDANFECIKKRKIEEKEISNEEEKEKEISNEEEKEKEL